MTPRNVKKRLPPLSAALAMEAVALEERREDNGAAWCAFSGVGATRRRVGNAPLYFAPPKGELEVPGSPTVERVRDQTRVFLYMVCRKCPHQTCPMKRW